MTRQNFRNPTVRISGARKRSLREIAHQVQQRHGVTITHMGVQAVLRREQAKRLAKRRDEE